MIKMNARTAAAAALLIAAALTFPTGHAEAQRGGFVSCLGGNLGLLTAADQGKNLIVNGTCNVGAGTFKFGVVHILKQGILAFEDSGGDTHFWARAILVENGGTLSAGIRAQPFGAKGGKLTIHLWGAAEDELPQCQQPEGQVFCGIDPVINSKSGADVPPKKVKDIGNAGSIKAYPASTDDYFYPYDHNALPHHGGAAPSGAYFGNKVLGVAYGGSLFLFGWKGAIYHELPSDKLCDSTVASSTGRSWVRLAATANQNAGQILVETPKCGLNWADKDDIVITTTDYLPGHSEQRKISGTPVDHGNDTHTITLDRPLDYTHNGTRFPLDEAHHPGISRLGLSAELSKGAETRAAVGLLSRSIRIVSAGDTLDKDFPAEDSAECKSGKEPATNKCYYGGHAVFRQAYRTVQIQGVEFYQMGQGGRQGRYPVHFHLARKTQKPDQPGLDSYVMDSSIWDSMTRWIVLHGTQDVTLARNVGYKSIGHGFYLEDATEINNKLFANLGVFARAAVDNKHNPRKVPGILAAPDLDLSGGADVFPYKSDYDHPTVFWITNGWNDFQYNMAAGAGTCGACYWMVNTANSTLSRGQEWESYAAMQSHRGRTGMAPLKSFIGNSCTTAMTSFQTIIATEGCKGLAPADAVAALSPIKNPLASNTNDDKNKEDKIPLKDDYYPSANDSGLFPTQCPDGKDCGSDDGNTGAPRCGEGNPNCMVTILDRYTTSFNWAAFNFAAIWLRPQWYLVTDSVITDSQQAGLTMVTGGGYEASSVIPGHWALVRKSVFIGNTQDCPTCDIKVNPYASNGGPFNPTSGLRCADKPDGKRPDDYCLSVDEGVSHQMSNFGMYQRLFSVYDGPAFQDSNAYLNITIRKLDDCAPGILDGDHTCVPKDKASLHKNSAWLAGHVLALPKGDPDGNAFCYMPNAAIGWKQPNGFYYPPAFHSTNLFFDNVDVRHFVITPLFEEGTFKTDVTAVGKAFCKWNPGLFNGFTSIDRQTVLNDDDGSLTGYRKTTVINLDDFFAAPVEAIQCRSENSSRTSPYDYVTTVVYPACALHGDPFSGDCAVSYPPPGPPPHPPNPHTGDWDRECSNENCYGIPLWRQDETPTTDQGIPRSIRMAGQKLGQRSSLTVNHGTYYLDTSLGRAIHLSGQRRDQTEDPQCPDDPNAPNHGCLINVFKANATYYLLLIFAKVGTAQTYQFYVGPTDDKTESDPVKYLDINIVQGDIKRIPFEFAKHVQTLPAERARWHNGDKSTGFVEVLLKASDLQGPNREDFATLIKNAKAKKCQPKTYCTWNDGAGRCDDLNPRDPHKSDAVCGWAVADVDCPDGGCFGIRFTMPGAFKTDPPKDPRPAAHCITKKDSPFDVTLADPIATGGFTSQQIAGACYRAPVLAEDFCK